MWIKFIQENGDVPYFIVGNKCDLLAEEDSGIEVTAAQFAMDHEVPYFSTSAYNGDNVEPVFKQAEVMAIQEYKKRCTEERDQSIPIDDKRADKEPCC